MRELAVKPDIRAASSGVSENGSAACLESSKIDRSG